MTMKIKTTMFCRYWTLHSACRISRRALFDSYVPQNISAFSSITTGRLFYHCSAAWYNSYAISKTSLLYSPATSDEKDNMGMMKEKEKEKKEGMRAAEKKNHAHVADVLPCTASGAVTMGATGMTACSETVQTTSSLSLQRTVTSTPFLDAPTDASLSGFGEPSRKEVFHTHEEAGKCWKWVDAGRRRRRSISSSTSFFSPSSSSPFLFSPVVEESDAGSLSEESGGCALFAPPPLSPFGDGLYTIPSIRALEQAARVLCKDQSRRQTTPEPPSTRSFTEEGRNAEEWPQEREHGSSRIDAADEGTSHGAATGTTLETAGLLERLIIACQRSKEQLALAKSAAAHYRRMEIRGERALEGQARALLKEATHIADEWKRFVPHRRRRRHNGTTVEKKGRAGQNRDMDSTHNGIRKDGAEAQEEKLEKETEKVEEREREEDEDDAEEAREWWRGKRVEAIRRVLTSSDAGGRGRLSAHPTTIVPFP